MWQLFTETGKWLACLMGRVMAILTCLIGAVWFSSFENAFGLWVTWIGVGMALTVSLRLSSEERLMESEGGNFFILIFFASLTFIIHLRHPLLSVSPLPFLIKGILGFVCGLVAVELVDECLERLRDKFGL